MNRCDDAVANHLLHPDDVADLLLSPTEGDKELLKSGIPFFDKLDLNYLVIGPDGSVLEIDAHGQKRVVAHNLDTFIVKLTDDPLFYEIGEERWIP